MFIKVQIEIFQKQDYSDISTTIKCLIWIKQKWFWIYNCSRFSVRNVIWDKNFRVGYPASIFLLMIVVVPSSERKLKKNHSVTCSPQAQVQDKECKMLKVHPQAFTLFTVFSRYLDSRVDKTNCLLHFKHCIILLWSPRACCNVVLI